MKLNNTFSEVDLWQDIESAFLAHPKSLSEIETLSGAHIFLTGGTGFFGCWLLESLAWFHRVLKIDFKVTLLTRDPNHFREKRPDLAHLSFLSLLQGDVRNFDAPQTKYTHFIHAATEASAKLNSEQPMIMFETTLEGTRRVLEMAKKMNAKRILLTSSGAVYGKQPPELSHVPEDFRGGPDPLDPLSAYSEGKRAAEFLCAASSKTHSLPITIARCFAFVGPYLPLDTHFAIGNFIRDSLSKNPIRIAGDGTPLRSYLYGADLVVWLWTVLLLGKTGHAYNVGSEHEISIADLAVEIAEATLLKQKIEIITQTKSSRLPDRYIPSTQKAQRELELKQTFDLKTAIKKTYHWYQNKE